MVKVPLELKSLHEIGLPVVNLSMKKFAERYPPPDRLKLVMINRGSQPMHVKTETGLRTDVPPMSKLMVDPETHAYSIWTFTEA